MCLKAQQDITRVEIGDEFRTCPHCGYDLGFHVSFLREGKRHRIVLICPNCGSRYDPGWRQEF
ncbi:MAG: hypothetical protein GKC10_03680 [Methanosarcinales archaeon]|nr:hypothetical protein [Methanosarcinales archaeon]